MDIERGLKKKKTWEASSFPDHLNNIKISFNVVITLVVTWKHFTRAKNTHNAKRLKLTAMFSKLKCVFLCEWDKINPEARKGHHVSTVERGVNHPERKEMVNCYVSTVASVKLICCHRLFLSKASWVKESSQSL